MISPVDYYDTVARDYHKFYDGDLLDLRQPYPANYIRLQILKDVFKDRRAVVDVGCGDGIPLAALPAMIKWGIDISPNMVTEARTRLDNVICADFMKPETYSLDSIFDGLICAGVMPHIEDTRQALLNMQALLLPGGKVFVEFRNSLFNLFTFNRLSVDFVVDELVQPQYRKKATKALARMLKMDAPMVRPYDKMLAKYHNPLEMVEMFSELGFVDVSIHWYHYHPTLPWMGYDRREAMQMEFKPSWRSMFICSAFVIEAAYE